MNIIKLGGTKGTRKVDMDEHCHVFPRRAGKQCHTPTTTLFQCELSIFARFNHFFLQPESKNRLIDSILPQ
jgi:hypothetical protein